MKSLVKVFYELPSGLVIHLPTLKKEGESSDLSKHRLKFLRESINEEDEVKSIEYEIRVDAPELEEGDIVTLLNNVADWLSDQFEAVELNEFKEDSLVGTIFFVVGGKPEEFFGNFLKGDVLLELDNNDVWIPSELEDKESKINDIVVEAFPED